MFKAKKILIETFLSISRAEVTFPEFGMVLLTGINEMTNGQMESVGSGKTALGEAIGKTAFGSVGRYADARMYVKDGHSSFFIELTAEVDGKPLVIQSGFKHENLVPTGEGLRFKLGDGDWTQRGHIRETRAELNRIIGVPDIIVPWTVYLDGDNLSFSGLAKKSAVDILMAAMNQPPWTQYSEVVRKKHTEFVSKLEQLESSLATLKEQEDDLASLVKFNEAELKKAEESHAEAERERESLLKTARETLEATDALIIKRTKKLEAVKKEMREIEEAEAAAYAKKEIKIKRIETKITEAGVVCEKLSERAAARKASLRQAKATLQEMLDEPDTCPTCGHAWDKKHGKAEIRQQKALIEELERKVRIVNKKLMDAKEVVSQLQESRREISESMRKDGTGDRMSELSEYVETAQSKLLRLTRTLNDHETQVRDLEKPADTSKITRITTVIEEHRRQITACKAKISEKSGLVAEAEKEISGAKYWLNAFSPSGIPLMVLRQSIPALNAVSKRLSSVLTGGTLSIQYETAREMASGAEKNELNITAANTAGARHVKGNSKGEGGLVNLIVAETLAETGGVPSRMKFKWYDEVATSQDDAVVRSIFSHIKNQSHQHKALCFVVDHNLKCANFADYILTARKTKHGTVYEWS